MAKLTVRIHGGKVEHKAEGFAGKSCREVGEAYLQRLGMSMNDANEEPTEVIEETEQLGG